MHDTESSRWANHRPSPAWSIGPSWAVACALCGQPGLNGTWPSPCWNNRRMRIGWFDRRLKTFWVRGTVAQNVYMQFAVTFWSCHEKSGKEFFWIFQMTWKEQERIMEHFPAIRYGRSREEKITKKCHRSASLRTADRKIVFGEGAPKQPWIFPWLVILLRAI